MKPLKKWPLPEKLILAGGVVAIITVVGAPILSGPVRAAVQRRLMARGPMIDRLVTRADEALELHLTASQKQAVKPVLIDAFLQMRQARHDDGVSPEARHAAVGSLREATLARLAAILTPDQMARLNAARARFDLRLSPGQESRMRAVAKAGFEQARAIRGDSSLNAADKRLKLIDVHTDVHAKMAAILTPEQRRTAASRLDGRYLANILAAELELNGQQKPRVQSIVQSAERQANGVFVESGTTARQKRDELRSIHQAAVAKIDHFLNLAQQKKLEEIKGIGSPQMMFGPARFGFET